MGDRADGVLARVRVTRRTTEGLAARLSDEDAVAQSMPDCSPAKWHLAHTTWFFERFVLRALGVPPVDPAYDYLWNSYYDAVGDRHPRPKRGLLTRPSLAEVRAYRSAIDARLADLEGSPFLGQVEDALELGLRHEEQHQELLLTDVKHLFFQNPLLPAYAAAPPLHAVRAPTPLAFVAFEGGVCEVGAHASGEAFSFDHERPRHKVWLEPFEIGSRLVTCEEYEAFVADGGYRRPELWLSEGYAWVTRGDGDDRGPRERPLYWLEDGRVFTLHGARPRDPNEPVCHLTYYEADAYARWAGARLPTEAEWEVAAESGAAAGAPPGACAADGAFHPTRAHATGARGLAQTIGDAWEWTSSAFAPYPGFRALEGAFGEYNGKFMVGQYVLRGGSCFTARGHARTWTRNFFPAWTAFQVSGVRLARTPV
jgi:ergothioneine biosynthesis protein EgtB